MTAPKKKLQHMSWAELLEEQARKFRMSDCLLVEPIVKKLLRACYLTATARENPNDANLETLSENAVDVALLMVEQSTGIDVDNQDVADQPELEV